MAIHPVTAYREKHSPPLSKSEVARLLNVSRNTVHRWETGGRNTSRDLLPVIESKLGIAPSEILEYELGR